MPYMSYEDCVNLMKDELDQVKNIKSFCEDNDIQSIQTVYRMMGGSFQTKYSDVVAQVLEACGYKIEKMMGFQVRKTRAHSSFEKRYYKKKELKPK